MLSIDHIRSAVGSARRAGARALFRLANWVLRHAVSLYKSHMIASIVLRAALAAVRILERTAAILLFGPRSHTGRTMTISIEQAAINLGAAFCLSAAIGFERQWRNRLAGLRTNTLVALGAASFVVFAALVPGEASPTRVAAQVVSGIGFLGAGLIFREGMSVRGLNTAATLWCSAAIGVLAGAGYLAHAALATGFVVFVNLLLRPIISFINRQPLVSTELEIGYLVSLTCHAANEAHVRALLLQGLVGSLLALRGLDSNDLNGSGRVAVRAHLIASQRVDADVEKIVGRLSLEPTITAARWQAGVQLDAESHGPLELRGVGSG